MYFFPNTANCVHILGFILPIAYKNEKNEKKGLWQIANKIKPLTEYFLMVHTVLFLTLIAGAEVLLDDYIESFLN